MAEDRNRGNNGSENPERIPTPSAKQGRAPVASGNQEFARPRKPVYKNPTNLEPQNDADLKPATSKPVSRPVSNDATTRVRPVSAPSFPNEDEKFQTQNIETVQSNSQVSSQMNPQAKQQAKPQMEPQAKPQMKPLSDETKRQTPVKVPVSDQTIKVSSDTEARSLRGAPQGKSVQPVVVSARNRNAADMDTIFRKEARMTEIPGSRSYPSIFYRLKRRGPAKQYRLKGYANKEYVKQRRKHQQKIQKCANIFFWVVIAILLLIVFYWIDPIDKVQEIMHLIGM